MAYFLIFNQQGFKFRLVGPPTTADIIKAAGEDALRTLDKIPAETIAFFTESAETLIKERGAVAALSAALAIISGSSEIKARSLLNSREVRCYLHMYTVIEKGSGEFSHLNLNTNPNVCQDNLTNVNMILSYLTSSEEQLRQLSKPHMRAHRGKLVLYWSSRVIQ